MSLPMYFHVMLRLPFQLAKLEMLLVPLTMALAVQEKPRFFRLGRSLKMDLF
jgi:hypothetical protein